MSDIQRIWASEIASGYPIDDPQLNHEYVLYKDHLAAIAEAEQRVREERYTLTGQGCNHGNHYIRREGFTAGVQAARDAVEAIGLDGDPRPVMTVMQGHYIKRDDALTAIDGCKP